MANKHSIVIVKVRGKPIRTTLDSGVTSARYPPIQFGVCHLANPDSDLNNPNTVMDACNFVSSSFLTAMKEGLVQQSWYCYNRENYYEIPDLLYYRHALYAENAKGKAIIL